ncbi:hypothetical protein SFRURICE_010291, partial [Spodoptera frugiperda]
MGEEQSNIDFCYTSSSEIMEEDIGVEREQQDNRNLTAERSVNEKEKGEQRLPEKRGRQDEKEIIEDDDGFTTVVRGHKKPARINSKDRDLSSMLKEVDEPEKCVVCVTSNKEMLPKQFGMAKWLRAAGIENITKMMYKGPYKVLIQFENRESALKLMTSTKLHELEYRAHIINELQFTYGILRQVDLEMDETEILENLKCEFEIESVKRLKRLDDSSKWINSETIKICFKSSTLPPYVYGYGCRFQGEPFTFPVSQCSICWKYGHLSLYCPPSVRCTQFDWEQMFSLFPNKCIIAGDFNAHHLNWSTKNDTRVQSLYNTFIRVVNKATDEHIPMLKTCTDPNKCFQPKPYWNPSLANLVAQRRLALSQFRKNPTPHNLNILEGKTLEAKEAIRQAKSTDWQNYCSSIDEQTSSSEMWKRMRWAKGFGSSNTNSQVSSEQKVELLSNLTPDYVPTETPENKSIPLLVSVYDEVKEEQVASSDPLNMFTLRMWVTNFNVNELIVSNLDCVTKSKKSYENSSLSQLIIDELHLKYKDWYPIFTDGAKNVNGQGAAFY